MRGLRCALIVLASALFLAAAQAQPLTQVADVYRALEAGRYAEVEAFYAQLRRDRTRTAGGVFLFEEFAWKVYWYSTDTATDPSHWPKVDAATRAWVAHSPGSYLAAMTRAFVLAYRAGGVEVRGGSWKDVDTLAAEARRLLDNSREDGRHDAMWHAIGLRVANVEALPRADVMALIQAAVAVDPYPVRLYQEAAIALVGNHRDRADDLRWLLRLAEQRTDGEPRTGMAARVLGETFWLFQDFVVSPFNGKGPRWDEVHRSFLDWKARYPASYAANLHGALACSARDREATASVLAQLGGMTQADPWVRFGGRDFARRCTEWVAPPQPATHPT